MPGFSLGFLFLKTTPWLELPKLPEVSDPNMVEMCGRMMDSSLFLPFSFPNLCSETEEKSNWVCGLTSPDSQDGDLESVGEDGALPTD